MNTTKALAHRVRQLRGAVLRAEVALTVAQVLFWMTLVGVLVGLGLRAARRRTESRAPDPADEKPAGAAPDNQV